MQLKPFYATLILSAFVFSACEKTDKSPAGAAAVVMESPTAPPGPNQGIEIPLLFKGKTFGVDPKTSTAEAKDGLLTLSAQKMSDVHLLSEPLEMSTANTYVIRGMVKAADLKTSKAPFAAGVGIFKTKMAVDFPAGTYDWKPFESSFTIKKDGPQQLTVGIGGWKTGQGTLEVKDLKLFK